MAVDGVNGNNTQIPVQGQDDVEKEEAVEKAAKSLMSLFGDDPSLQVDGSTRVSDDGKKRDLREIPEIDEPEPGSLEAIMNDLEALIALLQAEQDEKTIEAVKKRIESLKSQLEQNHNNTLKKINESIDEMKKQEKAALANKILGWIGVGIAVLVAIAMCCTVGGSIAAVAVVGAAVGAVTQILGETGVTDKFVKWIAKELQENNGLAKAEAEAVAQGIVAAIQIVIALALLIGGNWAEAGEKAASLSMEAVKAFKVAMLVTNGFLSAASISASAAATVINYRAAMKQAAVTEMQAVILRLQTLLEQESEDLKTLLEQLENCFGAVIELLLSKQDALNVINENIGA